MSDDGTAFRDKERSDDSGKTDIFFNNGPSDGSKHGHVVESEDDAGDRTYHHVRDVDGEVYADDSQSGSTPIGSPEWREKMAEMGIDVNGYGKGRRRRRRR